MYLKLSVAGHLTLFVARTRGRLWSEPHPARILLFAVIGTQILATVIAATGLLMKPLPLDLIALAWGYALIWILLLDQVKLIAYNRLERQAPSGHAGEISRTPA
jgi:H+-transporting ATPase